MKTSDITFLQSIIDLLAKYSVTAVIDIIKAWKINHEPTVDELESLKEMVPPAESFFK